MSRVDTSHASKRFLAAARPPPMLSCLVLSLIFIIILALTGFVCTHKIQAEEECLSSNILCYECDSRYDPNCADPFDFSPNATLQAPPARAQPSENESIQSEGRKNRLEPSLVGAAAATTTTPTNSTIPPPPPHRAPKKLPAVAVCHGCCVKITSKTQDGANYVRRTCTTSLQINYFMVGLVCMKESGDRGKMCFCENDYCNGQIRNIPYARSISVLIFASSILQYFIVAPNRWL